MNLQLRLDSPTLPKLRLRVRSQSQVVHVEVETAPVDDRRSDQDHLIALEVIMRPA